MVLILIVHLHSVRLLRGVAMAGSVGSGIDRFKHVPRENFLD